MPVNVAETWLASTQVAGLRGPARKAYETFLDDLANRGCAALGYRVTGPEPLPRLCVKHLRGNDRVVVAFENRTSVWILLVGPHEDDPGRNVYDRLYELAGVRPPAGWKRTRPECCSPTGEAPLTSAEVVDDLFQRARAIGRKHRNQFRR
ncbi:hypothetical protein [Allokutzneria oryzae]|uniref:DUF5655 domain-containing protein n=1 Tax=Allokutzneria oryzae TaxID=1378989 RepID=A0ABV5ZZT2_9PSEU